MYEDVFCKQRDEGFSRKWKEYMQRPRKVRVVCFREIKTVLVVRTYSESLILKNHCPDDNRIEGENLSIVV